MENINTKEHWDEVYTREKGKEWRVYPTTFKLIELYFDNDDFSTVIEFGCGQGILGEKISSAQYVEYLGIDISQEAIAACKEKCLNALRADVRHVYSLGADWVVATEFLEHFEQPEEIIKKAVEIAPNAIFAVPDTTLPPEECEEHYFMFTEQTFREMLSKYYEDVEILRYVDIFEAADQKIALPTLFATCRGRK